MKHTTKRTLAWYWKFAKPQKWWFFAAITGILIGDVAATATPYLYKHLFDALVSGSTITQVFGILALVALTMVLHWFFIQLTEVTYARGITRTMEHIRNTSFEYLHKHSHQFFQDHFVGSLVKRFNRFVKVFDGVTGKIVWEIFPLILNVILIIIVLATRHWALAAVVLVWAAIYCVISYATSQMKLKYDVKRAASDTAMTGLLADSVTNNNTIKLFSALKREKESYSKLTSYHTHIGLLSWDIGTLIGAVQWIFMIGLQVLLMYIAIVLYGKGVLTVGDFVLIQAYLMKIFEKLWNFGRVIRDLYEQFADAEEMTIILDTPHDILDSKSAKPLFVDAGEIIFDKVTFYYHKTRPIMKQFSLAISAGEKVALVGPSGAGKSTIVKLLLRLHDVSKGNIMIDGQKITAITQDSLHEHIAMVPQDPILFHRSLVDNIRYGKPDASDEEVIVAAKAARCHQFIELLQDGYDTMVGERGIKLSGGERQRIAIARAILKNSPILILDEATSSLDSESEVLIQEALEELMKGKTTITIAHRLSTIMNMDRIIVLEQGSIAEEGTHETLRKKKDGLYKKLWDHQAGGFITA